MFELYVMRHSKSSWSNLNLKDFDRPLNKRGKKNAKLVRELFVTKKVNFDYVLVSSSKRTKKTLQILLKKLKKPKKIFSSKKLYLTDEKKIIEFIKKVPKTYNSILLT
jgi:phosphohistidine phosphatase